MKRFLYCVLTRAITISLLALSGCSKSPAPIASGTVVQVTLGDKPVPRSGELGSWSCQTFNAGKIEIYDTCIIVTDTNGVKHSAPPDRFGLVRFR